MFYKKITVALLLLFICVAVVPVVIGRTWTAKNGHTIEGEFVKVEGNTVQIALANGQTATVGIDLLSDADQNFIKEQQAKAAESGESPFKISDAPATPTPAVPANRATSTAAPANSRTVTVVGMGTTFEDARKDAFRNAISQVVGTLVDAETRVVQEKVIEEIMTASNAYIESHKIIERKQEEDGLWNVTIEAVVQYRSLQERLEVAPTVREVDGKSIVERLDARTTSAETKAASEDDSILILAKALRDQNYPYSILEATATLGEAVSKNGNLEVPITLTVQPNVQKFEEFRKAIEPVLEKIAISKRLVNLTAQQAGSGNNTYLHIAGYREQITSADQTFFIYLNTARNTALTNTSWNAYELPNKAVVLFGAYADILPAVDVALHANDENTIMVKRIGLFLPRPEGVVYNGINRFFFNRPSPTYSDAWVESGSNCSALRANNFGASMSFPNYQSRTTSFNSFHPFRVRHFFLAPFFNSYVGGDSNGNDQFMFVPREIWSRTITLDTDELQAIKTIKSTVLSQNPTMDGFLRNLPEFLKNWKPTFSQ